MQLSAIDTHFESKSEPFKSAFMAVRQIILAYNSDVTEKMSYGMPFYFFRKKRICYLWENKKTQQPYIGFVDGNLINHPLMVRGDRKRMTIFEIDAKEDLPIDTIHELLELAIKFHQS